MICDNYSMTSGSLYNYFKDEVNDGGNENNPDSYRIDSSKTVTSQFFEYKTKTIVSTPNDNDVLNMEVVAPLK